MNNYLKLEQEYEIARVRTLKGVQLMTREMNKPDWHNKWCQGHPRHDTDNICFECPEKDCEVRIVRVLNPDIAEFVKELNERLGQK